MEPQVRASSSENWMLRLPQPAQLVGLVQVVGRRTREGIDEGLIASADREGFVDNDAFRKLRDLVRGAVELIAVADRSLQQEEEKKRQRKLTASIRAETRAAIKEVQANPNIRAPDKVRIVAALAQAQQLAERQQQVARERERQLEVMSLLGVVAGFMTHEFGAALKELERAHDELVKLASTQSRFRPMALSFENRVNALKEFATYASGYIQGARTKPDKAYPVRPRLQQVKRIFGKYAEERNINVELNVDTDLMAPLVPASLYNGIVLNLYTNALKAVTAKTGKVESHCISGVER
jgi:signal transduction histidine kinase